MNANQERGSIQIKNLTKVYHLYDKNTDRIRETFHIGNKKYSKDHYALRNITLDIKKKR